MSTGGLTRGALLYRGAARELSDRLVEAQHPIRILDAVKWDDGVEAAFLAAGGRELPPVDRAFYERNPLPFDPAAKRAEFNAIERDAMRRLGQFNPVGKILRRMCGEYELVVALLEARGTPEFAAFSRDLYGSAGDVFHAGDPSLADLGEMMSNALEKIAARSSLQEEERTIGGADAVAWLQGRMDAAFQGFDLQVKVKLSDGIVADAAAGADYIKVRNEARFNERELRALEVHEGWVHLGTTYNGLLQPHCTFLSKGPPSSTVTQEGLAILMEILSFASYPSRLRRLTNRIHAIRMAEDGANFIEVYRFFRGQGLGERESFRNAARAFRGSTPEGGPFTKDLSYSKGFILVYNFVQLAVREGLLARVPLLFCGKTNLEDMGTLAHLQAEGLVEPPRFLPGPFRDLHALAAWMCYSNFLNRLDLRKIASDYAHLLEISPGGPG